MDLAAAADVPPFDLAEAFQSYLLRQLCEDIPFTASVMRHMQSRYFENPIEAWACEVIGQFRSQYEVPPSWPVLLEHTRKLPPGTRETYAMHLTQVGLFPPLSTASQAWLRQEVLGFIKRQHLRATLDHAVRLIEDYKQPAEAEGYLQSRNQELAQIRDETVDRSYFFEELSHRQNMRHKLDPTTAFVTTGLPTLDHILGGGLGKGRLGGWLAYAKGGKSTLLRRLAVNAVRSLARVLYVNLEGMHHEVEDGLDAAFAQIAHQQVHRGGIPPDVLEAMQAEYTRLRDGLVIRSYTSATENAWNCSVQTIVDELQYQKQVRDWTPDLIIVDYADLLTGRDKHYKSTVDRQTAAYQDLKTLANRGYAIWTACQPQRPDEDAEIKPHVIRSRNVADCYAKVRICDFIGSINSTLAERDAHVARLYAEIFRGNDADQEWVVHADFACMEFREEPGLKSPHREVHDSVNRAPRLGYGQEPKKSGLAQTRAF